MSNISKEKVKSIAHMIRIEITDEEAGQYANEMNQLIGYANRMGELNTDEVEPTTHGIIIENVLRNDKPVQSLTQEEALKNAPDQQDGHFKVPSIME